MSKNQRQQQNVTKYETKRKLIKRGLDTWQEYDTPSFLPLLALPSHVCRASGIISCQSKLANGEAGWLEDAF